MRNIFGYQLSDDGSWFGFNSGGSIELMNVRTGERKQLLPCIEVSAEAFAFSPDSSLMAFGTGNGVIYLFEIPSGAVKAELRDDDWVQKLRFGPAGFLIATRTDGISVWNTITSQRVVFISGGMCIEGAPCVWQNYDGAELSPDGKLIATFGSETLGILVRDMEGKVILRIKNQEELGAYQFLPVSPNTLLVSVSNEFDFWDIQSKRIVKRTPHPESARLQSMLPGSANIVVETTGSGDSTDVQRVDINTGKVLSSWHADHYLTRLSPDGVWAMTSDREAIHMPTHRVIAKLEYIPSIAPNVRWDVDYGYLAARILRKEAPTYLVVALFLLLGVFGYLLCHASKYLFLAYLPSSFTLTLWWLRELWWPLHGPAIGRALGPISVTLTVLSMAIAYLLPIWAFVRSGLNWKSSRKLRLVLRWGLPLIAACLAGSLLAVSITQSQVEKERYQLEGDIRAGGELRGSGLVAWYERNLPCEAASAIYDPSLLISGFLQGRGDRLVIVGAVAVAFALWLLIAAVLFMPLQGKRFGHMLLAGALALIELGTAGILISLYSFNHIFRAYTPTSLLLHLLLWNCCIGGIAIWSLVAIRRERRKSGVPVG